jgi:hypothetical protein
MTDPNTTSPFSAVDATLGYLYQVRSALLWTLRRLKDEPEFLVSVETLDDVTFETSGGDATDLLQTKHHNKAAAALTDASPDLWKTLRIWFDGKASGQIPLKANLYLVTTAVASKGSAASRLRAEARDVAAAQVALDATAASSMNKDNKSAYESYLTTTAAGRAELLGRIVIIDASPTVTDLDLLLRQEVYWATDKEHHTAFLERLEGWWLRRILRQLTGDAQQRVGSVELEAQMSDLREQFKQESLPIDDDLLEFILDDATAAAHKGSTLVRQLEIIDAGKRRISSAIRDYYRAFEQRSRWLREDLVVDLDLQKYEKRLFEEWELVFDSMCDELGETAAASAKKKAARSVLAWAERVIIPIRPRVIEPFVTRGSLHMLSDEARIGWHPEFRDQLASVLGDKETA